MKEMTHKQARKRTWRRGEIVYYQAGQYAFGAVINNQRTSRIVDLAGLGPEYRAVTGRDRSTRIGAQCEHLRLAPTEYVEGEWRPAVDDIAEPAAIITYAFEPSPETGHAGWCWWAIGKMGDAASYEQAIVAAETAVRRAIVQSFCACGRWPAECDGSRASCRAIQSAKGGHGVREP